VNEKITSPAEEFRNLIINIVILVLVLVLLAVLVGLALGGMRFLRRRGAPSEDESFVRLHID
jgi:hypothetical protein